MMKLTNAHPNTIARTTKETTLESKSAAQPGFQSADSFGGDVFNFAKDFLGGAANGAKTLVGLGSAPKAMKSKSPEEFVKHAMSQIGTRYVLGDKAGQSSTDPKTIDCSGLVRWAAQRAGGNIPDGSWHQNKAMKKMPLSEAIDTRGALLYKPGHIAISLGNGLAVEAQPGMGVVVLPAVGRGWTSGGKVPGLNY